MSLVCSKFESDSDSSFQSQNLLLILLNCFQCLVTTFLFSLIINRIGKAKI